MKAKTILGLGFGVAFFLLVVMSVGALLILNNSVSKIEKVVQENNTKTNLVNVMHNAARERTLSLQKMLIIQDPFVRDEEWLKINSYGAKFAQARAELEKLPLTREETTLLNTQGNMSGVIAPLQVEIAEMIISGDTRKAHTLLLERAIPGQDRIFEVLTMLVNLQRKAADQSVISAKRDYYWAITIIVTFGFTLVALYLFIALYTIYKTSSSEQKLRIEKERAQTTLDSIADGVITVDHDGIVSHINEVAQQLTGWQPGESIGQPISRICVLLGHRQKNVSQMYLNTVFNDKRPIYLEKHLAFQCKNGRKFSVEGSMSPIVSKDGVAGAVFVFRDVTQRIAAEQELNAYKENLESLVAQRTYDLTEANKNLEAFSYSISHDLRAPLRGINGFSHALIEEYADTIDNKGQEYLQRIRSGTERIGNLMDDLLELSRVSSSDIVKETVDISKMAREVTGLLDQRDPQRKVDWRVASGMQCEADESLLWVLLENIFENAWKYTANNPQARVEFGSMQDGDEAIYYLKDNGVGFDMSYYNKLFGTFERLHHEAQYEGTGIGLATVKKIVQRHGGKVWAEGEVNLGATFYFTLGGVDSEVDAPKWELSQLEA